MAKEVIDEFTGKPRPSLPWDHGTGEPCDNDGCDGELVDRCSRCGAPVCCTKCCAKGRSDD